MKRWPANRKHREHTPAKARAKREDGAPEMDEADEIPARESRDGLVVHSAWRIVTGITKEKRKKFGGR